MIGYLGSEGSPSYHASCTFYMKEELVSYNNIGRLFYALEKDEVDGIVVPYENLKEGTNFDILGRIHSLHYHITKEIIMEIALSLVSYSSTLSSIKTVYGTESNISEAYNTLKASLGKYEKKYVTSNKLALELLHKDPKKTFGALVTNHEQLGSTHILMTDIRDTKLNTFKYVLIEKSLRVNGFHNRTLIACSPKYNRVGALYDILHEFVIRGINIIKILSIPTRTKEDDIIFYIDIEGNIEDTIITEALGLIKFKAKFVSILGSYYGK